MTAITASSIYSPHTWGGETDGENERETDTSGASESESEANLCRKIEDEHGGDRHE